MNNETPNDLRDVQPTSFSHVIGQRHVLEALRVAVEASFQEQKRLDEILLCGPPGLGKSALVAVLAQELAVPFTEVLAQSLTNAAELNGVLLSAADGILFLDEIHLLHPVQQHSLLRVLDKRRISISGGKTVQTIPVAPFTLVGATTDPDGLIGPLIDRFRMVLHLDYYSDDELADVVRQRCRAMAWKFDPDLPGQIARRARQTPRIALRILQSVRRCAVAEGFDLLGLGHLEQACRIERVSPEGLDNLQQKYVDLVKDGPVRLNVLASALGVSNKVLTKTVEPFLIRAGYVLKDDAGRRALSDRGREIQTSSSNLEDSMGEHS
jgi:holliday junction DNA helicase RuvB